MIPGETIASGAIGICECGHKFELEVLQSGAGYYIRTFCPNDGPYSRESDYYKSFEDAEEALKSGDFDR